jgi:hypothetical protein
MIWDINHGMKINRPFGGPCRFHLQDRRINQSRNQREIGDKQMFSILKMEAICSSETSVNFQLTTRRYIPQNRILWCTISNLINSSNSKNFDSWYVRLLSFGHVMPYSLLQVPDVGSSKIIRNVGRNRMIFFLPYILRLFSCPIVCAALLVVSRKSSYNIRI